MKEAGEKGLVWTPEILDKFLENPKGGVPGARMVFPGLMNPEDRADVIAYLQMQHGE
jgi:cytochrome c2